MAEQDDQMIAQMAAQQLGAPAPDAAPAQPQEDPAKQDNPLLIKRRFRKLQALKLKVINKRRRALSKSTSAMDAKK